MISDVSPSGAVVVHEYGECGDLRAGKASDADATIADGKLNTRYLFADIEYVQLDKDSLQGTISRDGTAIGSGVFTRVQ